MEVGTIHVLVRPHLLTFGFVYFFLRVCQKQHERGGWAVAALPPAMVLWANLHGGFPSGLVIVATAAFGHALSGPWDHARKLNLGKFALVLGFCGLAPVVNPYGIGLYRHVVNLLFTSGVTSLVVEFQPAPFGRVGAGDGVGLARVDRAAGFLREADRSVQPGTPALVWLHFALLQIRHAPLFALAAAPALARLLDGLPLAAGSSWQNRAKWSAWPVIATTLIAMAVGLGVRFGEFDSKSWPLTALPCLNRQPVQAPLFHEQDWGGMIEGECRPERRAFVDDRCELFGKDAIVEYVDALQGGPAWDTLL